MGKFMIVYALIGIPVAFTPATNSWILLYEGVALVWAVCCIATDGFPVAILGVILALTIGFWGFAATFSFAQNGQLPGQAEARQAEANKPPTPVTTSTVVITFTSDSAHTQLKLAGIPEQAATIDDAAMPYTVTFTVQKGGTFTPKHERVGITNAVGKSTDTGHGATCTITVDGQVVASETGKGSFAAAECQTDQ